MFENCRERNCFGGNGPVMRANSSTGLDLPCLQQPATMLDSESSSTAAGTIIVPDRCDPPSDEEAAETISDGCSQPIIAPPPRFASLRSVGELLAPRFRWPRLARVTSKLPRLPRPSWR